MNKPYFYWKPFLIDWRHNRLKNTIDLLLFYREHFYGFLKSDLWKRPNKKKHFITSKCIYMVTDILKFDEVLFCTLSRFVLSLKNSYYAYIPPYMNKRLSTLGNEKEQQQIKFYEKLSGRVDFLTCD